MKAINVRQTGGPEVLTLDTLPDPTPGPGEVLVAVEWAGVNYIDVNQRQGVYPIEVPFIPGNEGAGMVVGIGENVAGFSLGDRVVWTSHRGSYCELAPVPAHRLIKLPNSISTKTAAALALQGLTAHYLVTSVHRVASGDVALIHAAAGGVGRLLVQMVTRAGGIAIGTTSSDWKVQRALEAGATAVIRYDQENFAERVRELTAGAGAQVVYDSVGKATWEDSLRSAAPRATVVLYGAASGLVPPFDLQRLGPLGSLKVTRPTLHDFLRTPEEQEWRASELFDWVSTGQLEVSIAGEYELADAASAHRDLTSREKSGKLVLRVSAEALN